MSYRLLRKHIQPKENTPWLKAFHNCLDSMQRDMDDLIGDGFKPLGSPFIYNDFIIQAIWSEDNND